MAQISNIPKNKGDAVKTIDLSVDAIKHCSYIFGLWEAQSKETASDGSEYTPVVEVQAPEATPETLRVVAELFKLHEKEDLPPEVEKNLSIEISKEDTSILESIKSTELPGLIKTIEFLQSRLLLNIVCKFVAKNTFNKSEKEYQEYFGIFRDITEKDIEEVKAKYPDLFK